MIWTILVSLAIGVPLAIVLGRAWDVFIAWGLKREVRLVILYVIERERKIQRLIDEDAQWRMEAERDARRLRGQDHPDFDPAWKVEP